jgi:hypothetical protein
VLHAPEPAVADKLHITGAMPMQAQPQSASGHITGNNFQRNGDPDGVEIEWMPEESRRC